MLNYIEEACDDDLVANGSKRLVHQNIRSLHKNFDVLLTGLSGWEKWWFIIILSEIEIIKTDSDFYQLPNCYDAKC